MNVVLLHLERLLSNSYIRVSQNIIQDDFNMMNFEKNLKIRRIQDEHPE